MDDIVLSGGEHTFGAGHGKGIAGEVIVVKDKAVVCGHGLGVIDRVAGLHEEFAFFIAEACVCKRGKDPGSLLTDSDRVFVSVVAQRLAGFQQFFPGLRRFESKRFKRSLIIVEGNAGLVKRQRADAKAAEGVPSLGQNGVVVHVADKAILIRVLHIQNVAQLTQIVLLEADLVAAQRTREEVRMNDIGGAGHIAGEKGLHLGHVSVVVRNNVDRDLGFRVQLGVFLGEHLFACGIVAVDDRDDDLVIFAGVPCCVRALLRLRGGLIGSFRALCVRLRLLGVALFRGGRRFCAARKNRRKHQHGKQERDPLLHLFHCLLPFMLKL